MSHQHGSPGGQPPPYAPAPPGFGGPPPAPGGYAPAPPFAPAPSAPQYQYGQQPPPYGAPGGGGPRRSRTGLVIGLVAGGLAAAVAVVVLVSVLDGEPEVAAPTMPSLDMTEIIDVLNPVEVGGTTAATTAQPATSAPATTAPAATVPPTEQTSPPVDGSAVIDLGGGYSLTTPGAGFEIFAQDPGFLGMTTPTGGEVDLAVDPAYGQADAAQNVEAELRAAFAGAASEFAVVGTPEPLQIGVGTSAATLDFTATLISENGGGLPTLGVGILVVKGDGAALLIVAQTPNADFQVFLDTDVATVLNGIRF